MPIDAAILLAFALAGERLLNSNFLSFFLARDGHLLMVVILPIVAALWLLITATVKSVAGQRTRFWVLVMFCALTFIIQWHKNVNLTQTGTVKGSNDGVVQTEVAVDFLQHGKNPYAMGYKDTSFGSFASSLPGHPYNQSWDHYAYLPAPIVLSVPLVYAKHWLGSWAGTRTLYILLFAVFCWLLIASQSDWSRRTLAAVLTIGNPMITLYVLAGFNDILWVAALAGAAVAIRQQKWVWAGLAFGLAMASKQTVWWLVPLWGWWLWSQWRVGRLDRPGIIKVLVSSGLVVLAIVGPFALWNWPAFYDDTVRFVTGGVPFSFPISGTTFLQFLYVWRLVPDEYAPIPTLLFHGLVAVPLLWWYGRQFTRRTDLGFLLTASTALILAISLVNRYFYTNYLSAILMLAIVGWALTARPETGTLAEKAEV